MMMDKNFITLEESKDQLIGKVGTPERDKYEEELRRLHLTPIEDYIIEDFGAEGTPTRVEFDADVDAFGKSQKSQITKITKLTMNYEL